MKIGIITWFSGSNYGTNLQAIALQNKIRAYEHNVELVNFEPPFVKKNKTKIVKKIINYFPSRINRLKNVIVKRKFSKDILLKEEKMKKSIVEKCFFSKYINSSKEFIEICNSYDVLIFGSDQIWNPNWFHPYYYADFEEIKTLRIAYAPSIGVNSIDTNMKDKYKQALNRFESIAVREEIGVELLRDIIDKKCLKVVDPTLLLSSDEWNVIFNLEDKSEEYILFYLLTDNKNHIKAVQEFSKKYKLNIKVIPYQINTYLMKHEICANVGNKEFLELIKNAKYIITDSYHGILFSIIFKKQFYALTRFDDHCNNSQNSRIYQIMNEYNLRSRLQKYNIRKIIESNDIDYSKVYEELEKKKKFSIKYLEDALKGERNGK